jgi:hypothetical protein
LDQDQFIAKVFRIGVGLGVDHDPFPGGPAGGTVEMVAGMRGEARLQVSGIAVIFFLFFRNYGGWR